MNYSYERISTGKQDERRQELAFENIKIDKKFLDKMSGKTKDRPELNKLKLEVRNGDNIYCESISRLGRNVDDLRELCEDFKNKGVTVHFIKEGLNTDGATYKFLLTILGAVAEMERELIVERVKEGMKKAQIHGTKSGKAIGRPQRVIPEGFEKAYRLWKDKVISQEEAANMLKVSRMSFYRYIKLYEDKDGGV